MTHPSRAKICIVTPGAIGSDPRAVKEADALHAAGYEVTVIATRTLDHVDARDEALMRRTGWRLERIDLRARADWRRLRAPQLLARKLHAIAGWDRLAVRAFSPFTAALGPAALRAPADLYIAHYPAALPAAAAAARRHGARLAYDAEDFHQGDCPDIPAFDRERRLVRSIEERYLPACAYVTAASPGIADAYAQAYGVARPRVVLNVFALSQAPDAPTPRGTARPGPSIYWFSQTIGADRGLECAVRAIALAQSRPHLHLRGTPAQGYEARLRALASQLGVPDRLHFLPPAAPDDMERLASVHDLGLVSETCETHARRLCLTNKLFSYLLAGVPPLMSATQAQARFAEEAGLGDLLFPADDAPALAALVDRLLRCSDERSARREAIWTLAHDRYNWEAERPKLVALVEGALRNASCRAGLSDKRSAP